MERKTTVLELNDRIEFAPNIILVDPEFDLEVHWKENHETYILFANLPSDFHECFPLFFRDIQCIVESISICKFLEIIEYMICSCRFHN
jgi:hypothetical protein